MVETKKAPDYTNSAENLCNPQEVKELIDALHLEQANLEKLQELIPTQLMSSIQAVRMNIDSITEQLKVAIEQLGSYQNIEAGHYAVKYCRMHKEYHVEPFKKHYPIYTSVVIAESINVKALEGLIKGGLLNEDELKHISVGVITETPQYAFFIR